MAGSTREGGGKVAEPPGARIKLCGSRLPAKGGRGRPKWLAVRGLAPDVAPLGSVLGQIRGRDPPGGSKRRKAHTHGRAPPIGIEKAWKRSGAKWGVTLVLVLLAWVVAFYILHIGDSRWESKEIKGNISPLRRLAFNGATVRFIPEVNSNSLKLTNSSEKGGVQLVTETPLVFAPATRRRFFQGWRKGIAFGAATVAVALLLNILSLVIFITRYGSNDGMVQLYEGPCETASRINFGTHLVINILGTLMLSASNYCMQVLSAPTRGEVDRAHGRKRWMDIGLSSARNLGSIARWRMCLWVLLVVSSLPLHLIYNSVVFTTTQAFQYTGVLVSPGFIAGPVYNDSLHTWIDNEVLYNPPDLADIQQVQADAPHFERLENAECINAYRKALVTDRSDLVLVTANHNASDTQSKLYLSFRDGDSYISFEGLATWICDAYNMTAYDQCMDLGLPPDPSTWSINTHRVEYCLSRPRQGSCTVQSSVYLTTVVIVANVLKLAGLLLTLFGHKEDPLVTLGDAVNSFITAPDPVTANACLLSRADVKKGPLSWQRTQSKAWKSKRVFRFQTVSLSRWSVTVLACVAGIVLIVVFLDLSIIAIDSDASLHPGTRDHATLSQLWAKGFGVGEGSLFWQYAPQSLYGNILLANLPQLIFSVLYFIYNGLFTAMSLAAEWSAFASSRKGLRVSDPQGAQRSTYYLQLPYTYALPLIVASAAMHWLISQSFFVLAIDFTGSEPTEDLSYVSCGYSPIAIIFALALGCLMLLLIFVNGFRRLVFSMPIAGGCSLAISAACHAPADGADSSLPLQWGVVASVKEAAYPGSATDEAAGIGHCSFSSAPVTSPVPLAQYA